ncbi:MAG: DNA internalization-related competence protein ComEC/Rec2 [Acidobacteria bacterium]|nr:DNA internalization-related competence protein ComEC/Rec2 [Acidobacteriota bacterium]
MTGLASRQASLDALWSFVFGIISAIGLVIITESSGPSALIATLGAAGGLALLAALRADGRSRVVLLLVAGIALGGWRGLGETRRLGALDTLLENPSPAALRVTMTVLEGWTTSRWGHTTRVRVQDASHASQGVDLPRRCRLEVRNSANDIELPPAGADIRALVALKGTAQRPLLVAASPNLLEILRSSNGAPAVREFLAASLVRAAGTDPGRIRSAELAAALALGRRDMVPAHRRQGWRSSGLSHALAVSGLHVGIVSGTFWLIGVIIGLRPTAIRWALLLVVPSYTILAGAAPSAVRACLMVCLYLAARLLGRAAMPLGTVLTAASVMLLVSPGLILDPGFQLTVGVTAALIRWAPPLTERLRGPRWLRGAAAIPVVAQIAAAPIVAVHFKTATPLAAVVNLAIPLLLTPAIPLAVAAVILAPIWQGAAGWILELIRALTDALWVIGSLGRHWTLIVPTLPSFILLLLVAAGLPALRYDRLGRAAGAAWITLILVSPIGWFLHRSPHGDRAELLPIGDGLALTLTAGDRTLLFDGGHYRSEAAEMLADTGCRHLAAVIVSHGDEDHAGGIQRVLESAKTDRLVMPSWLMAESEIVPILRAARHSGTPISMVAQGSIVRLGPSRLDVLWPPAGRTNLSNNDRSLVIRARTPSGPIILTGDIGAGIERTLARTSNLKGDVLLIPHHGSASSTSGRLLDAVSPSFALIPAGQRNRHHHPHPTVLDRLSARGISFVFPARDGRCGARPVGNGRWEAYTEAQ